MSNIPRITTAGGLHMIEVFAIVLLIATAVAWMVVATPEAVSAWVSFARDLDPSGAADHAVLFADVGPTTPA